MANSPFGFTDDAGFEDIESNNPVVQKTSQAVKNTGNAVVKQTTQQASATAKAVVNMLYGPSTPAEDAANPDSGAPPDPQGPKPQNASAQSSQQTTNAKSQDPDKAKLEETRKQLQHTHIERYYKPEVEDAIKREAQKREQAQQQEEQKAEEKKMEDLEVEKKKQNEVPLAVQQARSKAERRPGAG